jgi:hypothetical protein
MIFLRRIVNLIYFLIDVTSSQGNKKVWMSGISLLLDCQSVK